LEILGYGEDALTLWALRNRHAAILRALGDTSDDARCQVFYRPDFGRGGANGDSGFGAIDFILMTDQALYLGATCWDRACDRLPDTPLDLRENQRQQHTHFAYYVEDWLIASQVNGRDGAAASRLPQPRAVGTTLASESGRHLTPNLLALLEIIRMRYGGMPPIANVLLYLYDGDGMPTPGSAADDFIVIPLDYSEDAVGHFINLA
jgi:hypothetical protein